MPLTERWSSLNARSNSFLHNKSSEYLLEEFSLATGKNDMVVTDGFTQEVVCLPFVVEFDNPRQ